MAFSRLIVRRRVIVNLLSDKAIEGVIVRKAGTLLFLKDCVLHEPGEQPTPLDGEVIIDRPTVDFIQAL